MRRAALIMAIIGMVCASLGIWAYQSLPTFFDGATHLHPTSPTKQVWSRYWAPTLPFLPSDGALVFSTRRPDPVLQGDAIVALALDGQLHEVDVATGHDRWNFSPDQGAFVDFAVDRGLIVGLGRYGVSASSGSQHQDDGFSFFALRCMYGANASLDPILPFFGWSISKDLRFAEQQLAKTAATKQTATTRQP